MPLKHTVQHICALYKSKASINVKIHFSRPHSITVTEDNKIFQISLEN
jgi:hypothetical protein